MPVRMKDMARDLNVSVVTVSKAPRHQSNISPATKRRILKRVQKLNYQPNWIARSLVSGRTHTIGLVVPNVRSSFFAEVARGIFREGTAVWLPNDDFDFRRRRAARARRSEAAAGPSCGCPRASFSADSGLQRSVPCHRRTQGAVRPDRPQDRGAESELCRC